MSLVAGLQLPTLPMSESKLDYYFRICAKKEISLVVLGEYVLNSFYKELANMPKSMVKEQSQHKIKVLKALCTKYGISVVAPLVLVKKDGYQKVTAKFTPKSVHYYPQYWLIHFKHWNEERFFLPSQEKYDLPVLLHEGIRYGIVGGFEAHYDSVWADVDKKRIDAVLMPSIGAFNSQDRWRALLMTRAFTHNVYIIRVNRIGSYRKDEEDWHFYGDSTLFNPYGEVELSLGDKEEMLIANIEKSAISEARRVWGWRSQMSKKGII
ncbi:MAG: carbon-nitrogen hydrolase family protein [Campylobacteraceae bacterium]|nr:carbon-nitrogen hydrolase family protein [Campylobacteraceae bacterium]